MKKPNAIYIKEKFYEQLKKIAIKENRPMISVLEEAILTYIQYHSK